MDKKNTTPTFTIPTGQELFDSIMGHIEPELTSEGLKKLDQMYAHETSAETDERKQRYELAFEQYEQAYQGYMETLHAQADRYRRHSFGEVELEHRGKEEGVLSRLQNAIFQAA